MIVEIIENAIIAQSNPYIKLTPQYIWDNTGNNMVRLGELMNVIPIIGTYIGRIPKTYAGYKTGEKLGHPTIGALFGREAVLGAASKHDPSISLKNVYTKNNLINRGIGSAATLGGAAIAGEVIDDNPLYLYEDPYIAAGLLSYAALYPIAAPAVSYKLGEWLGDKIPDEGSFYDKLKGTIENIQKERKRKKEEKEKEKK